MWKGAIDEAGPADRCVTGLIFRGLTFNHAELYPWHGDTGWALQHHWEMFDRPRRPWRFRGAEDCVRARLPLRRHERHRHPARPCLPTESNPGQRDRTRRRCRRAVGGVRARREKCESRERSQEQLDSPHGRNPLGHAGHHGLAEWRKPRRSKPDSQYPLQRDHGQHAGGLESRAAGRRSYGPLGRDSRARARRLGGARTLPARPRQHRRGE